MATPSFTFVNPTTNDSLVFALLENGNVGAVTCFGDSLKECYVGSVAGARAFFESEKAAYKKREKDEQVK